MYIFNTKNFHFYLALLKKQYINAILHKCMLYTNAISLSPCVIKLKKYIPSYAKFMKFCKSVKYLNYEKNIIKSKILNVLNGLKMYWER